MPQLSSFFDLEAVEEDGAGSGRDSTSSEELTEGEADAAGNLNGFVTYNKESSPESTSTTETEAEFTDSQQTEEEVWVPSEQEEEIPHYDLYPETNAPDADSHGNLAGFIVSDSDSDQPTKRTTKEKQLRLKYSTMGPKRRTTARKQKTTKTTDRTIISPTPQPNSPKGLLLGSSSLWVDNNQDEEAEAMRERDELLAFLERSEGRERAIRAQEREEENRAAIGEQQIKSPIVSPKGNNEPNDDQWLDTSEPDIWEMDGDVEMDSTGLDEIVDNVIGGKFHSLWLTLIHGYIYITNNKQISKINHNSNLRALLLPSEKNRFHQTPHAHLLVHFPRSQQRRHGCYNSCWIN